MESRTTQAPENLTVQLVPKVELHCHLEGIIDPPMVRELNAAGIQLGFSAEELDRVYPVVDRESFWRWFAPSTRSDSDLDQYRPVLASHVARLRAQNVIYAEIMFASGELWRCERSAMLDRFREFREYAHSLERGDIQIEFIAGWNRRWRPAEEVDEIARRILLLYEAGLIAGVFLAGPEEGNPVQRFARTFDSFHDANLQVEIHAGEWCGPESVWDALEYGHPDRIGHGVAVYEDPRLLERVRAERIHVEMCPTSNILTGAVQRIEEHPIERALADGLKVSINTDDPGAFRTSMTSELQLLTDVFGFTTADFVRIAQDALAARFQPELRYANARALTGVLDGTDS